MQQVRPDNIDYMAIQQKASELRAQAMRRIIRSAIHRLRSLADAGIHVALHSRAAR